MYKKEPCVKCSIPKLTLNRYRKIIKLLRKYKDETSDNKKMVNLSNIYNNLRGMEERFYKEDTEKCRRMLDVLFGESQEKKHPIYVDMSESVHIGSASISELNLEYKLKPSAKSLLLLASYCCRFILKSLGRKKELKKIKGILKSNGFKYKKYGSEKAMKKLEKKLLE